MPIRDALLDTWALLMPVQCAGCGADDRALCEACRAQLLPEVTVRMTRGIPVFSALDYEGVVRSAILAFKEHDRTDVAAALAAPLAAAISRALAVHTESSPAAPSTQRPELALVPTSRGAWRRRGYCPVQMLVRRCGVRTTRVLSHRRATDAQKELGAAERATNLLGAFVARRHLHGRSFVIVDDILTSGATITEAARAIEAAGGEVVAAATIAFTRRFMAGR